ncbi:MAG: hypothetical protein ABSB95_09350 [Dissulfurispiraceae bacterium]|jgi:hypothetical protein
MKTMFFALAIAILIMPQSGYAESPDNKGADEEYMLLLKYALDEAARAPDLPSALPHAEAQEKARETEQKKKIIITIIPDP